MDSPDREQTAIQRLKTAAQLSENYYHEPMTVCYSGGKDSEVILELCRRAGVPYRVVHNLTTADAPETVRHVRKVFYGLELAGVSCTILKPFYKGQRTSMWQLIPIKRIPPTRRIRYCCTVLKENSNQNCCTVLGIRKLESSARSDSAVAELPGRNRSERVVFDMDNGDARIIAPCQMKATIKIHPIVDWTDAEVWQFLRDAKVDINPVYGMGFNRVGCVGCPMAGKIRYTEFRRWPKYAMLYRRAFGRMVEVRRSLGKDGPWDSADEVFRWWMEDKNLDGQIDIFGGEVGAFEP
ncbi:phosphoadenosine phosphosulfate reductase family protein [Acutalibacter muris]|uniref:phosphoadenosine phosphosulfate reductase family protein n=1 Tax=Acutalibacter muris TaxID=1796620 RepID=UPI001C3EBAC6|nr:phosphoadenosine phosphosulfate reductase family protein [Acutalibacter muris]